LGASISVKSVRVPGCSASAIRVTLPGKSRPGISGTRTTAFDPRRDAEGFVLFGAVKAAMQHHNGGYYICLLTRDPPRQRRLSRGGRRDKSRWDRSCSATPCPPLSLSPMRPAKNAVHNALAAVRRDRVISGRPQVNCINYNRLQGKE
jgi:hypothetical protein